MEVPFNRSTDAFRDCRQGRDMSTESNKRMVQRYFEAVARMDEAAIRACLSDDFQFRSMQRQPAWLRMQWKCGPVRGGAKIHVLPDEESIAIQGTGHDGRRTSGMRGSRIVRRNEERQDLRQCLSLCLQVP